jgi:TM2 domain-containing membrane protein YozV
MEPVGNNTKTEITPEMASILNRPDVQPATHNNNDAVKPSSPEVLIEKIIIPRPDKQRHFIAAFMFSFYFGLLGADRFYLGKYFTGILKFLTLGGLSIWAMVDLQLITSGNMKDKWGNPLIDAKKYKKFAKRTIFWTYAFVLILILLTVLILILSWPAIQPLIDKMTESINTLQSLNKASGATQNIDINSLQQILKNYQQQ